MITFISKHRCVKVRAVIDTHFYFEKRQSHRDQSPKVCFHKLVAILCFVCLVKKSKFIIRFNRFWAFLLLIKSREILNRREEESSSNTQN